MLRLLLDENISPEIARQLARKAPGFTIIPMREWQNGRFMGVDDSVWIPELIRDKYTLVTYDRASIAPYLRQLADQGQDHAGIIFIDHKSIPQGNFGLIVKALLYIWKNESKATWKNRVIYLKA